jgi:hypothetical protein
MVCRNSCLFGLRQRQSVVSVGRESGGSFSTRCQKVLKEAPELPELRKLRNKLGADTQPNPSDWQDIFTEVNAWSHLSILFSTAPDPEPTSTETGSFPLDWSQVRRRAATHFKKEQYFEAIHLYVQEIGSMKDTITGIAVVTSNMATAHIMEGNFADAMLVSTVSVMLNKKNAKSWLRRSRVLENAPQDEITLEYLETISNMVKGEKGGSWEGCESFLEICDKEIWRKIDKNEYVKEVGSTSTEQQLKDRDVDQNLFKEEERDIDEYIPMTEATNSVARWSLSMAFSKDPTPVHSLLKTLSARKCPRIHEEYAKAFGWAIGLDAGRVQKIFYRAFLNSDGHPWLVALIMTRGSYPFTPEAIAKRWHGQAAKMYVDRRDSICVGDILDARSQYGTIRYDHRVRSSFIMLHLIPYVDSREDLFTSRLDSTISASCCSANLLATA